MKLHLKVNNLGPLTAQWFNHIRHENVQITSKELEYQLEISEVNKITVVFSIAFGLHDQPLEIYML